MKKIFLILGLLVANLSGFAADVAGVSGAILWLKADEAVANSDGTLKQWNDATGVHKFKFVGDKKNELRFVKDGLNGRPVIKFPGDAALESTVPMTYMTFIAVTSLNSEGCVGGLRASEKTDRPPYFFTVKKDDKDTKQPFKTMLNDGANVIKAKFSARHQILWASFGNPAVDEFMINGDNSAKTKVLNRVAPHSLAIGCGYSLAGKKYFFLQGDVAEIIAFPNALTKEQRFAIEDYLAQKYGITIYTSDLDLEKAKASYRVLRNSRGDVIWNGAEGDMPDFRYYLTYLVRDDAWGLNQPKAHGMGNTNQTEAGALTLVNGESFAQPKPFATDLSYVIAGTNKEKANLFTNIQNPTDGKEYSILLRQYRVFSNSKGLISLRFALHPGLVEFLDPGKLGLMVVTESGHAVSYPGVFDADYNAMVVNGVKLSGKDSFFFYINIKDNNNLNQ